MMPARARFRLQVLICSIWITNTYTLGDLLGLLETADVIGQGRVEYCPTREKWSITRVWGKPADASGVTPLSCFHIWHLPCFNQPLGVKGMTCLFPWNVTLNSMQWVATAGLLKTWCPLRALTRIARCARACKCFAIQLTKSIAWL